MGRRGYVLMRTGWKSAATTELGASWLGLSVCVVDQLAGVRADVDGVQERGDEGAGCPGGLGCRRALWIEPASAWLGLRTGRFFPMRRGRNRRLRSQGYVHAGSFRPKHAFHSVCLTVEDRTPTTRGEQAPNFVVSAVLFPQAGRTRSTTAARSCRRQRRRAHPSADSHGCLSCLGWLLVCAVDRFALVCADVDGVEERGDEGAGCPGGLGCRRALWIEPASTSLGLRTGRFFPMRRERNRRLCSQGYTQAASFRQKNAFHSVCLTMEDRTPTTRGEQAARRAYQDGGCWTGEWAFACSGMADRWAENSLTRYPHSGQSGRYRRR
jgi:hypothetical protein